MIYWSEDRKLVEREFIRMGFDKDARWRISDANKDFELCNTYPRFLIVPSSFKDEDLESVAKFRYFRRIPTAVWRHIKNGCFIVRSSQPTVGWFGWFRNELDENLVQSYVNNTIPPTSERTNYQTGFEDNNDEIASVSCNPEMKTKKQQQHVNDENEDRCGQETMMRDEDTNENDNVNDDEKTQTPTATKPTIAHCLLSHNHLKKTNDESDDHGNQNSNHNNNLQDTTKNVPTNDNEITTTTSINTSTTETATKLDSSSSILVDNVTNHAGSLPMQASTLIAVNGNGAISNNNNSPASETSVVTANNNSIPLPPASTTSKMLIIDARSYAAAMANRAKGGGCECSEYYQRCEVHFMNLANIHSIRKSYHAIRSVCETYSEQSNNWVSFLDNSRWLHHISGLLKSALLVVDTIDIEEKSILIHCSDGWDRTPQLVALAEIMLDPHYRTFDGFRTLIQREWLDFGHKFADRCGSNPCNEDPNERCPVFLQWLDCVQQLLVQYPKHFEFNSSYLDKLNRHTYSNVFGTFSYNSTQERILSRVDDKVLSLWSYFDSSRRRFRNEKYVESDEILRPSFKVRDLHFWKEVYLPPIRSHTPYLPIATNNIDNRKFYDSLYIDGLTRTVCK